MPNRAVALTEQFFDLTTGRFAALVAGEENAPPVLFFHGFPDIPASFSPMLETFARAGYRTVAPYMRGYRPSPLEGPLDPDALADDVLAWSWALSPDRPVAVIGHDWGAVATYVALGRAPHRFRAAVTLAVPHPVAFVNNLRRHPTQLVRSWYMGFFQLGPIADWVVTRASLARIDRLWAAWSPGLTPSAHHLRAVKETIAASMPYPVAYYRAMARPPRTALARIRRAARPDRAIFVPTLHLTGRDDGCIAPEAGTGQEAYFAGPFASEVLDGVGHFLHLEQPDAVARRSLAWLAEHGYRSDDVRRDAKRTPAGA
jgi:pimeloyl-ACP methyl ester carboxylesterase